MKTSTAISSGNGPRHLGSTSARGVRERSLTDRVQCNQGLNRTPKPIPSRRAVDAISELRFGAFFASTFFVARSALASEPVKPTTPGLETNPAVPALAIQYTARHLTTDPGTPHKMPGMGEVHFAVATKMPEAQSFIDQGVAAAPTFLLL